MMKKKVTEKKCVIVHFRVSKPAYEVMRAEAQKRGIRFSEFLRRAVLEFASGDGRNENSRKN